MEQYMKNLRKRLYEIMSIKGWNQRELSIQCNLSYREIYSILGRKPVDIRLSTISRISSGLEKPIYWLLDESPIEEDDVEFLNRIHSEIGRKIRNAESLKGNRLVIK